MNKCIKWEYHNGPPDPPCLLYIIYTHSYYTARNNILYISSCTDAHYHPCNINIKPVIVIYDQITTYTRTIRVHIVWICTWGHCGSHSMIIMGHGVMRKWKSLHTCFVSGTFIYDYLKGRGLIDWVFAT